MAKKRWLTNCAVLWCVCLTKKGSQHCAVHSKFPGLARLASVHGDEDECEDCNGTGDCGACDGDGTHQCGHEGCSHEHDCGTCDGSGLCPACRSTRGTTALTRPNTFAERYIAFAFDPGWIPPAPPFDSPWDEA